jgi:predicted small lipoprotein YifL
MTRAPTVLATAVLACASLGGCGDAGPLVVGDGDYALPGETLEEWVSYGDQLSVISVLDATQPKPWPAYKNSGGLAGRQVTVRVERTLWRRPGAPHAPAGRFRFTVWGWMWENDQDPHSERRPILEEGAPRMQPGRRYLALLVRMRGQWNPIRGTAVMTLAPDDRITAEVETGDLTPGAGALRGKTIAQAGALLAATKPDPLAARFADLPPQRRLQAVARERG